jgi:hypothetical protein
MASLQIFAAAALVIVAVAFDGLRELDCTPLQLLHIGVQVNFTVSEADRSRNSSEPSDRPMPSAGRSAASLSASGFRQLRFR